MQLLNTLYVTLPESYVHLDNNTVRLEVEHETRLRVPLHHLQAVVCFGRVSPRARRYACAGATSRAGRNARCGRPGFAPGRSARLP